MSALLGLKTRLGLARTMAWVGVEDSSTSTDDLRRVVAELSRGRADIVVLSAQRTTSATVRVAHEAARKVLAGRTILGLAGGPVIADGIGPDLLLQTDAAPTPFRSHEWSLVGRSFYAGSGLDDALADPRLDVVVVSPHLVEQAAALAPPALAASKPWFAHTGSVDEAADLVRRGARRIAFAATGTNAYETVVAHRAVLERVWAAEMEQVEFAAFRADARLGPAAPGFGAPGFAGSDRSTPGPVVRRGATQVRRPGWRRER
ncbi:hypothetical protein GCM10009785_18940 [Brooklawnia cerclae]|uniref:Uncharacterized protein n=1 Tax=Brooklawnia cerclae TaxID=349934 RepID=A0ABX0SJP6_9ACTN|nr:hypothetical protein [Brooklawnia cerclae]NIH57533.1 hypothetical protein [Brooklawnia cerclae]